MREILFRGKREDNGEWVYGFYFEEIGSFIKEKPSSVSTNTYLAVPETVGQFTGLTDKNGKKIFEGDIVRCYDKNLGDEFTAVVEFGNPNYSYNWGFQLKPITETNFNTDILLWVEMEETGAFIEIIGNIHDIPGLLKGGTE